MHQKLIAAVRAVTLPETVSARTAHYLVILGSAGLIGAPYFQEVRELMIKVGLPSLAAMPAADVAAVGLALLVVSLALQVAHYRVPSIEFGVIKTAFDRDGRRVIDLPVRQTGQVPADCRVKMKIESFDGSFRDEVTLQTETRLNQGQASIERVTIDDAFKDFRIFRYNFIDEELTFYDVAREFEVVANSFRLQVFVAGVGPRAEVELTMTFCADQYQSWLYVTDGINGHGISIPTYS